MESLRYVVCGRPECRQVFFLCTACDRGRRYCARACSERARRESVRAAGARYQRTRDGRHAHAARQAAWRARQKVTHQSPVEEAREESVALVPAEAPVQGAAAPSAARPPLHALPSHPACTTCGRTSPFLRHTTLARTHVGVRWRRSPR